MSRPKVRIRRGDRVRVIAGKHRGAEGEVIRVLRDANRILIKNVNVVKKSQRPTQDNPVGGFLEQEAPVHVSNVQLLDPQSGKLTRVGFEVDEGGHKHRVARKSGVRLDE